MYLFDKFISYLLFWQPDNSNERATPGEAERNTPI
jgi:hypothetical protein